jgi:D-lyxose ketol-isomerase
MRKKYDCPGKQITPYHFHWQKMEDIIIAVAASNCGFTIN